MWEHRNGETHGRGDESRKAAEGKKAMGEPTALHELQDQAMPKHQDMHMESPEAHAEMLGSTDNIVLHNNTWQPTTMKSAMQNAIDIRECFRTNNMETNLANTRERMQERSNRFRQMLSTVPSNRNRNNTRRNRNNNNTGGNRRQGGRRDRSMHTR